MRMHGFRYLTVVAAVAALGLASPGAAAPQSATVSRTAAADPLPGAYISPWGDADVEIGDEVLKWMEQEGVTLEAIAPFTLHADGKGISMPIGSTAGDGLDSKGRIYYPGGLTFRHKASGRYATLKPTYIRVMPTPGWSAGVEVDGEQFSEEVTVATTSYAEVMLGARPSLTGFRLQKVPFYFTEEASNLVSENLGRKAPGAGSLLGTLTPNFDYVPGTGTKLPGILG